MTAFRLRRKIPPVIRAVSAVHLFRKGANNLNDNGHSAFERADAAVVAVLRYISWISGVCLIAIMLIAFFNVLGEKIFHYGIPMSNELIQYLHIPVVFLAAAYVTLDRGHVKIDLLSAKLPQRVQWVCTLIGNALGVFICGFISQRGFVQMGKFFTRHKMSSVSGMAFPLWPFALIFSIGFAMFAFSFLWSIVRQVMDGGAKNEL